MCSNYPDLDETDLAILECVQRDNQLTSTEIAERVSLSPTSVQRRLARLRSEKVIEADVAIVSAAALGRPLSMLVAVELERETADIIDAFKSALREAPEVMSAWYVTGETDFMLVVSARDMGDYERFTRRFFYGNPAIKTVKTTVVMDEIKRGFFVSASE